MKAIFQATGLALAFSLFSGLAWGQDATGLWLRDTGRSQLRVAPCGPALCGTIAWLADPAGPAKLGQKVIYDMFPDGQGGWSGKAFNPEDGKTYSGKMTVSGDQLTTAGCALGGLICKSVQWRRLK
jgi:uncharacterized protein (DUF2147 family)